MNLNILLPYGAQDQMAKEFRCSRHTIRRVLRGERAYTVNPEKVIERARQLINQTKEEKACC